MSRSSSSEDPLSVESLSDGSLSPDDSLQIYVNYLQSIQRDGVDILWVYSSDVPARYVCSPLWIRFLYRLRLCRFPLCRSSLCFPLHLRLFVFVRVRFVDVVGDQPNLVSDLVYFRRSEGSVWGLVRALQSRCKLCESF